MSNKLQPVRGTHDLLPDEMRKHRHIIDTARKTAGLFGYEEMATPIFEKTEVFARTLGDTSDIVTKEMYTFQDRGGESITLRPEGTAGVARALISEGLQQNLPLKYFYSGPMFRYERPQKGRLRQFHQTGVEFIGEADPWADAEVIIAGVQFLHRLGLGKRCVLEINSLGDQESRAKYRGALLQYLQKYRDQLSKESQERLERNPLRILDSKSEEDQKILMEAPNYSDSLSPKAGDFFNQVQKYIYTQRDLFHSLKDPADPSVWIKDVLINPRLVRGLDYYCHTCFEITCEELGAQKTVLAGGRYDGLIRMMGGPDVPGVGWASGVERLALLIDPVNRQTKAAIVPILGQPGKARDEIVAAAHSLWYRMTMKNYLVETIWHEKFPKALSKANKQGFDWVIFIGEDELKSGKYGLRNMNSGQQELLSYEGILVKLESCRLK